MPTATFSARPIGGGGERRRHGVRDCKDCRRLRQHAHHTGQLQRNERRSPDGSLIADSNGDLFGTTERGENGTVFEIAKTAGGYASTPTILVSFNNERATPLGGLIADANGDLFGLTEDGGTNNGGTVFEITDSGFEAPPPPPPPPPPPVTADILWQNTSGQASIWEMDGNKLTGGGPVSPNPGPSWRAVGTGDFFAGGSSGILWQNTSTGQISIWEMNGNSVIGGGRRDRRSRAELARRGGGRFQRRHPFRHPVAEHDHRPSVIFK